MAEERFIKLSSIIEEELSKDWTVEHSSKTLMGDRPNNQRHLYYQIKLGDGFADILDAVKKVYSICLGENFRVSDLSVRSANTAEPSLSIDVIDISTTDPSTPISAM